MYGEKWITGAIEEQSKKGDVFSKYTHYFPMAGSLRAKVAASMQALRLAAFLSRPNLRVIQTLVMIGPYLTDSGRFLDSWTLFGTTVRLAQAIGCMILTCSVVASLMTKQCTGTLNS